MFTGIIEHIGIVQAIERKSCGVRMEIRTSGDPLPLKKGCSVAINGVCLTVTDSHESTFLVDVVQDTLSRTNLSRLSRQGMVNIELPLAVGDHLDGHILEGHVDGTGIIVSMAKRGIQTTLKIRLPRDLDRYVVKNGSIGVDGVSLTIKEIRGNILSFALIPTTVNSTSFSRRKPGDKVNIEVDRLGKYIEKQLNGTR